MNTIKEVLCIALVGLIFVSVVLGSVMLLTVAGACAHDARHEGMINVVKCVVYGKKVAGYY